MTRDIETIVTLPNRKGSAEEWVVNRGEEKSDGKKTPKCMDNGYRDNVADNLEAALFLLSLISF